MTKEEEVWIDELMAGNVSAEEEPVTLICHILLFIYINERGLLVLYKI